eukprot:TRINITY_DN17552_c0_g1_i1.p1 TRINITY_DN17552_c0_g1~~TRINITY_DN17552_c0_g1_i1.p1  ORF type:complete len:102 (-),score=25.40 TRINITY_DN17552_c0_g1_i1:6-281(-)
MCIRDSTYQDSSSCKPCSKACLTCYGPTSSQCLECNYLKGYGRNKDREECYLMVCTEGMYLAAVSYTHLRAHETSLHLVCRLLLEKKKKRQ